MSRQNPPLIPQVYWGKVTVDGEPAPDGTIISAYMVGHNPHVHFLETKDGKYGATGFEDKLFLSNVPYGEYLIGEIINFLVMLPMTKEGDKIIRIANETAMYDSNPRELDLTCDSIFT